MPQNTYGDIPNSVFSKESLRLCENFWRLYKEQGWPWFKDQIKDVIDTIGFDIIKIRFDEAIVTAKEVTEGRIKQPEKIITEMLFPPSLEIRADLQQGCMKLLYGDSVDLSLVIIDDSEREIMGAINGHFEDGIPVDWWMINPEDEVLDRRHPRIGYKLKELPKKIKNINKIGSNAIDIFKDIRNERTPQWSNSSYLTLIGSGLIFWNELLYTNNYQKIASFWDLLAPKTVYGLKDNSVTYVPWPPFIQPMIFSGRKKFTLSLTGLGTDNNLFLSGFREGELELVKSRYTLAYDKVVVKNWEIGSPYPKQSLNYDFPNINLKNISEDDRFKRSYPGGPWIKLDDLGMTMDDAFKGVHLDINHETEPGSVIVKEKVISTGIGHKTTFRY